MDDRTRDRRTATQPWQLPAAAAVVSASAALVAVASVAVAVSVIRRPAVGPVTMGPGGWVSVRGAAPRLRASRRTAPGRPRPWWARVLRAHRLVVE